MKMRGGSFLMKDNYTKEDFKNAVIKNYGDKIPAEEKILMTIKAYIAAGQIQDKDMLRKEVDLVLA